MRRNWEDNIQIHVGLQLVAAVVMTIFVFWDIMPFNLLKINRRFGGTCLLHLQGRISQGKNQHETGTKQLHVLSFDPIDGGEMSLRNVV
jgi:hypothetical protein